jgi:VIT1/CCC1 family predicted Fe2+/Mn2+ transporter
MYEVPLKRSAHAKLHGVITHYTTIGILVHIPVTFILSHSVGISETVRHCVSGLLAIFLTAIFSHSLCRQEIKA